MKNNQAKKLVVEKKVVFEIRDEEGFTTDKGKLLLGLIDDAKKGKNFVKGKNKIST